VLLLPGELLAGKYRIERPIGMGGMGMVYRAEHVGLRRIVAIKVLHSELVSDSDARARFEREARAAAAMTSHHCVAILDVDRMEGGAPYIVLEHVDGSTLHDLVVSNGPLSIAEVVAYARPICAALGEAHALGIVHRDLKPANVMRASNGVIKVLDFGLALGLPSGPLSGSSVTSGHRLVGSPNFIAPEQIVSPSTVDARADIWALGGTLFFLLTGRPPFQASNVYLLTARILGDPTPHVHEARRDVPPMLSAIVARCLAREPASRFPTMRAVAEALRGIASVEGDVDSMPSTRRDERNAPVTEPAVTEKETARVDPHAVPTETMKGERGSR
jgi:serine/threonine-protein kinase